MKIPNGQAGHSITDRDGFVLGEGAGAMVLEELGFAKSQGRPYIRRTVRFWHECRCESYDTASTRR